VISLKEDVMGLIMNIMTLYYYSLLIRLVLEFTKEQVRKHPASQFIFKLTKPVIKPLKNWIPDQYIGDIKINVALILLLFLYRYLMEIVAYILRIVLI
jgi:uncharacterized protein YggT (Ycf19 family)